MAHQSTKALVAPTLSTGAKASNDAGNYTFSSAVRSCLVSNNEATVRMLVRCNVAAHVTGANEASTSQFEYIVGPGETLDVCMDEQRSVADLSVYVDGTLASANNIQIWGLTN